MKRQMKLNYNGFISHILDVISAEDIETVQSEAWSIEVGIRLLNGYMEQLAMKTISERELKTIIENHKHWLNEDCEGWESMKANLYEANLYGADLRGANLRGANLYGADLRGAKNIPFIPMACPDTGAFIAWKKVNGLIIKLQIPEDAKRSSATTTKCRCDKALVVAIEHVDGTPASETSIVNMTYAECRYTVGEMVYPDSFDEDRWNECSHGIHFFVNRQEAVDWRRW